MPGLAAFGVNQDTYTYRRARLDLGIDAQARSSAVPSS